MEIGIIAEMPTYSGGLGVLAGDTIRAAADLRVPMVAVTLLHRNGYCHQRIDADGNQTEEVFDWDIEKFLTKQPGTITLHVESTEVEVAVWQYEVEGVGGFRIPVLFLDTDLPGNAPEHRNLTHNLYGGDQRYRLCQEKVLGIGGVRVLRELGYNAIERFHMNEGHASLLVCELLDERRRANKHDVLGDEEIEAVRRLCVFTTHTPVPAGHDKFSRELVNSVLHGRTTELLDQLDCMDDSLNMTYLALNLSHYVNGVAKRHGQVSREMFAPYPIDSITNGVHAARWVAPPMQKVLDAHLASWREDNYTLRTATSIPRHEIWAAHQESKNTLIDHIKTVSGVEFDPEVFTIGFARRAAAYKRADMFYDDLERLLRIHNVVGKIQVVYAGKAHPSDEVGKDIIRRIVHAQKSLAHSIKGVYLADYDIELCHLMAAGVDLWLNTPEPPKEASGTSGMKAALNGIPSLSVLDGWWLEGWIEGQTGWAIGRTNGDAPTPANRHEDAAMLYDKLEYLILPLFYERRTDFIQVMRNCIALNGSFFNTQRMMSQYVLKAYFG